MIHGHSNVKKSLNGTGKLLLYIQDRDFNSLANNMIKLSVKYLKTL